jgi:glycosyltransferase involved in cell wall biosynthesis
MKALHLDQVSANPEVLQKKNQQSVKGADIFGWSLLSALLEYGTYDAYLTQGLTEEKKQLLLEGGLSTDHVKRLVPVPFGQLPLDKRPDQLIFLTAGRYLNALAVMRQKVKRDDAPICGFIHSINSARIALALLQQCFVGLSGADLLLCSSRAGMKAIDIYVDEINEVLPSDLHYQVRRALVPLGVNIPNVEQKAGTSLRQRLSIEADVSIALYFGRLSQGSKCDLGPLLVALSQLLKKGKKLYLIIAGDDTQRQETPRLQTLASELGCQKNVKIWPNSSADEKHLLYSGADFFVSPVDNMQETFGLAVAEAMAYGLPAVVSDWNGYRDLVTEGETGFLIPSVLPPTVEEYRLCDCVTSMLEEDLLAQSTTIDVVALSHGMERLAVDSELRVQMGQAAKGFVESHCTWRVVVKRYEELWEESLAVARIQNVSRGKSGQLLNVSLEKCFGHYANAKRTPNEKCFISEEGREWLKRPGRFYFLGKLSASPCPQKFVTMLNEISNYPGISAEEVVQPFSNNSEPKAIADAHWTLARLFKYGLVSDKIADENHRLPVERRQHSP